MGKRKNHKKAESSTEQEGLVDISDVVAGLDPAPSGAMASPLGEGLEFTEEGNERKYYGQLRGIRTIADFVKYAEIDETIWEVYKAEFGKWEVTMREPAVTAFHTNGKPVIAKSESGSMATLWTRRSRKPMHEPMYKIRVWVRRRVGLQQTKTLIEGMLKAFADNAPVKRFTAKGQEGGALLEVSIFDLHLGKLVWAPESGQDYDVKIAQSAFTEALEALIERVKGFKVARVLLPVGNDFFNVDGKEQMTSGGTPQSEDGRWQKSFVAGRKLMLQGIYRLREIAPVDVIMVPGNHDIERVFYLGDALAGWLSKSDGITVNNDPPLRKYYQWGRCLVAFTHGKEEKHNGLPLIMATEQPDMWAQTKFREIHLGHLHHKKEKFYWNAVDEFNGIRIRVIPSLCPACAWHTMKGYAGLRAAEAFLWDKEDGMIGSFSFSP